MNTSYSLSKNKLNFILAQKSRKNISNACSLPLKKENVSIIKKIEFPKEESTMCYSSRGENKSAQYPQDIIDTLSENRSFIDNMSNASKRNYQFHK